VVRQCTLRASEPPAAAAAAIIACVAVASVLAMATGSSAADLLGQVLVHGWPAALWLVSAWGWGRLAAGGLGPAVRRSLVLPPAIGAAILLGLDSALLRLTATPAAAWTLTVAGLLCLAISWRPADRRRSDAAPVGGRPAVRRLLPLLVPALLPAGALLMAAAAAPGWLWASEFGGYDALSYHLQLPAEWAEAGRAGPLEHNVYSFLPNALEHAFLHLGLLTGDPRTAGVAAQLLHAAMTLAAAATIASLARATAHAAGADEVTAARAGAAAAALLIATPWTVVCGSLAYCEMAVLWMMAASMRLTLAAGDADAGPADPIREGLAHGLLCGAAIAAKLTAGPLAVVPAILWWLLLRRPPRTRDSVRRLGLLTAAGVAGGLLMLAPWLLAGWRATGNPVFPFAAEVLGRGHWNAEQVAAWKAGHGGSDGVAALGREWLAHGIDGHEPPQWGLLPAAGLLAGVAAAALARDRRGLLLAAPALILPPAIIGWALLTHAQSRFLLPTAVPLALATSLAPLLAIRAAGVAGRGRAVLEAAVVLVACVQCLWSSLLLMGERDGRAGIGIGATAAFRGETHERAIAAARQAGDRSRLEALIASAPPTWWVRSGLGSDARVLMIGEAAVLHHDPARIAYRTVWDRDELTRWLDAADREAADREAAGRQAADEAGDDRPASWAERARAAGFTHAYVDRVMLENWAARGWNDPRMRWERLEASAGRRLPIVASFDGGGRLLVSLLEDPPASP
jgi:hypothetical protein